MLDRSLTIEQVLPVLSETPRRIAAQLRATASDDEWSASDLLAHLRSCADVWGRCIQTIIAQDAPTIRVISPRTWIRKTDYLDLEFQPSLQAFTKQRADLLAILEPLPFEHWSFKATVIKSGKAGERNVLSYAESLALHEQLHLVQIERVVEAVRQ